MGLTKSKGNMYPWVTHTHSHLAGQCPHLCGYCFVQAMAKRFPNMKARYSGKVRLMEDELAVDYGNGKTIFIEHMNDLFAKEVSSSMIYRVISHCAKFKNNTYVFQTKNPARYAHYLAVMPPNRILGTTIETNRSTGNPLVPLVSDRANAMANLEGETLFVTIEPIMDFDVQQFAFLLGMIKPTFINIGADSKQSHLPEPSKEKVLLLIEELKNTGIEVRQKPNLNRLLV